MTFVAIVLASTASIGLSQSKQKKTQKKPPFSWVSPASEWKAKTLPKNIRHATFKSPSMGIDVGYYVYLPDGYDAKKNESKKYPVVYHLHGGRPGSESKTVSLATFIDKAMRNGKIQHTIYVFPNGGPVSWYNYPQVKNGQGERMYFVKELIPHVDATYRTFGTRAKRGIQGFSQGGRGTTRIIFKHPELFGSTAPGGSGYEPEERIRDNDGAESDRHPLRSRLRCLVPRQGLRQAKECPAPQASHLGRRQGLQLRVQPQVHEVPRRARNSLQKANRSRRAAQHQNHLRKKRD